MSVVSLLCNSSVATKGFSQKKQDCSVRSINKLQLSTPQRTRSLFAAPRRVASNGRVLSQVRSAMAETTHVTIPPPFHPTFDIEGSIRAALEEDSGSFGDVTALSTIPEDTQAVATFLAKGDGVLAGLAVADKVFEMVDPRISVEWSAKDGDSVTYGTIFGKVRGPARGVLVAERVALNYMQRMGGIATATAEMVKEAEGFPAKILETRKTVPGLRLFDKWAVLIGGGDNHRMGLYDMIMIKDNHIAAAGGLTQAVERAQAFLTEKNLSMGMEVETRTMDEVREVMEIVDCQAGKVEHPITRVMLDNMTKMDPSAEAGIDVSMLEEAVAYIGGRVETEGSGNVNLQTVRQIASTGVTYISVGALTHSVKALDISFNIETQ
uniref:nicotinate-nucleotide diphosphorylase (carboxylating) n=1 Tax=Tetraselmis sp. GSL018 TaxID=582737 RepID=A0A061S6U2_9CHLO|mmetsp:Transcript_36124/g.85696  ORF Transcript_36124/g.85696 Transcript_36124/m.85696 type:complete len:380 (+) Transcript_36124:71-1210(+)